MPTVCFSGTSALTMWHQVVFPFHAQYSIWSIFNVTLLYKFQISYDVQNTLITLLYNSMTQSKLQTNVKGFQELEKGFQVIEE